MLFRSLLILTFIGLTLSIVACASGNRNGPYRSSDMQASSAAGRRAAPREPVDRDGFRRDMRSGTLTAGNFDDAQNPGRYADWVGDVAELGPRHGFVQGFDQPAIQLNILNGHGDPVHGATVVVHDTRRQQRLMMSSGTDGRCVFFPGYDGIDSPSLNLTISAHGVRPVNHTIQAWAGDVIDIEVQGASAPMPEKLDLALVIDTTGSMGDELEYLKVEFRAITERIAERFPHVDQRWAIVVYRDQGDAYVVRDYDFTSSLNRLIDRLGDQQAAGGGDYPEAVDQALDCALELNWRDDAAKVAFLIADAPPHADHAAQCLEYAAAMRARGIAMYPVASSGVKAEAEYIFRTAAMMTGGAYSFLTDDSGVGNRHTDPHQAPDHSIQRLDDLVVQLVESELSGQTLEPRRRDVLRQVPEDGAQHTRLSANELRELRDRRENLARMLRQTELSPETRSAIQRDIEQLDRRIAQARQ